VVRYTLGFGTVTFRVAAHGGRDYGSYLVKLLPTLPGGYRLGKPLRGSGGFNGLNLPL